MHVIRRKTNRERTKKNHKFIHIYYVDCTYDDDDDGEWVVMGYTHGTKLIFLMLVLLLKMKENALRSSRERARERDERRKKKYIEDVFSIL